MRLFELKNGKFWYKNGRSERIRTSGLCVPNAALYQAEPRSDFKKVSQTVRP